MATRNAVQYFEGDSHDVAIVGSYGIAVSLENDRPAGNAGSSGRLPGAGPSGVIPTNIEYSLAGGDILPWGEGNNFPKALIDLYDKDPLIPPTLGRVASLIASDGIVAGIKGKDAKGNETLLPLPPSAIADEIDAFLDEDHFKTYVREMSSDVGTFFNGWGEMIVSKDRSRITQIHPLNAEECRWGMMTEQGDLPNVYLSADWHRDATGGPNRKKLDALDPYRWDKVEWLRDSNLYKCVYPLRYPTPGKRFYAKPHHYSLVESGWLDVHLAIPEFKKYLMKNSMTIKYHWRVDKDYWATHYGEKFTKANAEGKRKIKQEWLTQMTKSLTDVTKAGNSIVTDTTWDQTTKTFKDHITVTPVADTLTDGKYLEDNIQASQHILYAFNIDPAIFGFQGGSSQSARSGGSDKREAYTIAVLVNKPFRDMVLEPLYYVARFNGWKDAIPKLVFRHQDKILTTLDTGAGTTTKIS